MPAATSPMIVVISGAYWTTWGERPVAARRPVKQVVEARRLLAREQDQRLAGEAAQRDPAALGERMVGRDRGDRALAHHDLGHQRFVGIDRGTDESDVEQPGGERAQLFERRALAELDLDARAAAAEALDDPGHDRQQRRADEVDAQQPRLAGLDPPDGRDRDVELVEHRARVSQERLAGRGELDAAAGAVQQPASELILEPRDLLAQGRLGDVQASRRTAEVKLLGDGDEVTQLAQFHGSSS